MNCRIIAAALLFAVLAFTAGPAAAQGYAGMLPDDRGAEQDNGALPFMSNQMDAAASNHASVTGGADAAAAGDQGGDYADGGEGLTEETAAEGETGADGEPVDVTDIYGLQGDTTLSTDKEKESEGAGQTGFMAAFAKSDKEKERDLMDPGYDPLPENMYRAMDGGNKAPGEVSRQRVERAVKAAEAQRLKEIDAMNAERTRDHQIRAQAELDRILGIQQEAMEKVRDAQANGGQYDSAEENTAEIEETAEGSENTDSEAAGDGSALDAAASPE